MERAKEIGCKAPPAGKPAQRRFWNINHSVICAEQMETGLDEVVMKSQAGCRESFEMLVEHFEERVFHFLNKIVNNTHDAEDLTQETFVKVYKNLHRYKSEYSFSTWVFTIAKRTAYNYLRSRRPVQESQPYMDVDERDPSKLLASKESSENFWDMTRRLKPQQQEMLWLRYGEGFSIVEIAEIMKTNQVFIRVNLHRARNQLVKTLEQRSEFL